MERTSDYWFMIEPYVHINIANGYMLLYNTLDKETIISNNEKVINLLEELLQDENCGVTILKNEQYRQNDIHSFITNLREKYMGDIIDISLSKGKPIQILPHTNFCNKRNEKYNFIKNANLLHFLNEIIIHLDHILDQDKLIDYLQSMPDNITYSISGDLKHIAKFDKLVDFLNQYNSSKKIICNYINFAIPASVCKNIFLYKIHIHFPIDIKQLIITTQSLKDQNNLFELIFDIASLDDYLKAWEIIEEYQIDKYQFNPIYTGYNIDFFKENVFLKKSDILSTSMSIKDFFIIIIACVHNAVTFTEDSISKIDYLFFY